MHQTQINMEMREANKCISPDIEFQDGVIDILGRSIQDYPNQKFERLINAFLHYSMSPLKTTEINIRLEYINSSTNRLLMNLLIIAESIKEKGFQVTVNWYYDIHDELMLDQGNIFKSLINVPFIFIET